MIGGWYECMKNRAPAHKKRVFLTGLVLVEAVLFATLGHPQEPKPEVGYLLKIGPNYVVTWRVEKNNYYQIRFSRLNDALSFARLELALKKATFSDSEIEHVWLSDRGGSTAVLWKITSTPYLNRWTFDNQMDAKFFAKAFQGGGYSQSPFGHSLLLLPLLTN